ncbi:sulfite exporter TauE/SafE family protein [Halovenus sp. WSH3]|uniref:Sulfite exporter TauE/SafE family protein n=1 Tax=Halovenus carboxidivorans TaxID=2692199 RepID=A0A6B0T074_9EURY|nr:sulfite exporter TauE/SafE family protein [Halovenus carboxidivorans]MXR51215.1 sulfite exporter TauE/SafE family protein [Halovenus carboxidivorans]
MVALFGTDVLLFLLIGLLAGAHCIGMCGPLVTIYAKQMGGTRTDGGEPAAATPGGRRRAHLTLYEVRQHALFNLGRTLSYTVIGALVGALGGAVFLGAGELAATANTVRGVFGVVIGAFVILTGGVYVLGRVSVGVGLPGTERITAYLTGAVDRLANGPGIVGLGAVHGLLPCPILYPAYLYAFSTGSPVAGGIALFALGVGTVPTVFAYGTIIESVGATHRQRLHRVLGGLFVVLGYVLFAHGLMALGVHIPHPRLPFWDPLGAPI